jgi:hypothetical protein
MDFELVEREDALLSVEASEIGRHLELRARLGALLRLALAAFSVFGRLP